MVRASVSVWKDMGSNPIGPMNGKLFVNQAVSDTGKFTGSYQGRSGLTEVPKYCELLTTCFPHGLEATGHFYLHSLCPFYILGDYHIFL